MSWLTSNGGSADGTAARTDRLQSMALFATLTQKELRVVRALQHERDYLAGEVVFDQGEEGQALYVMVSGRVAIGLVGSTPDASFTVVAELAPGDFFGEMALLDDAPRMAQARALEDCCLVAFFREDFMLLLETHPTIASKIAIQLARHMGQRLRAAGSRALLSRSALS